MDVYCERCGTLQQTDSPDQKSLGGGVRRLISAMGLSADDDFRAANEGKALRLCLGCREYTCPNCWNAEAGVCLSCEPLPEPEVVHQPDMAPEPASMMSETVATVEAPDMAPTVAEPDLKLPVPLVFEEPEPEPEPEPVAAEPEPEPEVVVEPEPEPEVVAEPEPEPEVVAVPEPEPAPQVQMPPPAPLQVPPQPQVRPPLPAQPQAPPPSQMPRLPLPQPGERQVRPSISFDAPPPPAFVLNQPQRQYPPASAHMPSMASAQAAPSVKSCRNCQLELSARAQFCRRCGTAQS